MRKLSFYPRLALQNIKLNRQFYLPYILTCIATVAMFYIMCFLTYSGGMKNMDSESLGTIFMLGCIVIGLFSTIFLFYTNSFLMKRRQKEIGLYNILGMGKGNIAGVLFFETLFVALGTVVLGLCLGILLSKLMLLFLHSILKFNIPYGFEVPGSCVLLTLGLFLGIFLLILLSNLLRIKLSNPIELLKGGNVGEKEPKTRWVLAVLGILALGAGYYIAVVTESPLQAIMLFFVAVILVIIGTYLLFTASSIAILKRLKAKPEYYYKAKHFIPVSGMIYRMKQNAVGLANICILSTMVLVMVSGTVSLYIGAEDAITSRYPHEICVNVEGPTGNTRNNVIAGIEKLIAEKGYTIENVADYQYIDLLCQRNGNDLGSPDSGYFSNSINCVARFVSAGEYEHITGKSIELASNEASVCTNGSSLGDSFIIFGDSYKIKTSTDSFLNLSDMSAMITTITDTYLVVLSDEAYSVIMDKRGERQDTFYYGFDFEGTSEEKLALYEEVSNVAYSFDSDSLDGGFYSLSTDSRETNRSWFYELSGGFLFLGIFLGIIFLMATVLIIYYKQLSEGYDDRERFEIMQKVGLSKSEIKKAIHSQILVVFFLPLGMAVVHICFAFKIITRLLTVFYLTNVQLFAVCTLCTVAVFAIIYAIVYALTAKTYYRVVSE